MKKLCFILFAFMAMSIVVNAQANEAFSKESAKQQLREYFDVLQPFVTALEGVPSDFSPKHLYEFSPYLQKDAAINITSVQTAYDQLITFAKDYNVYHGDGAFATLIQNEIDDIEELPSCFDTWYSNELLITASTISCCVFVGSCPGCIVTGGISSLTNMAIYENCLEQYDNP